MRAICCKMTGMTTADDPFHASDLGCWTETYHQSPWRFETHESELGNPVV